MQSCLHRLSLQPRLTRFFEIAIHGIFLKSHLKKKKKKNLEGLPFPHSQSLAGGVSLSNDTSRGETQLAAQCCTRAETAVRELGDPSPGNGRGSLATQTGSTADQRWPPIHPFDPPAMEFHLLNVEAVAGSLITWLSLFLSCVGASRARGSWSAQAGEKAT